MSNLFEIASRKKFRFPSPVGDLTLEQVWDLPLTAGGSKPSLDATAQVINRALKALGEESFVQVTPDPRKAELSTKLDIVKHIIAVKQDELAKAEAAAGRATERRKLLDALASHEDKELQSLSKEEILKRLAEVGS